jgi:hypothetical protein
MSITTVGQMCQVVVSCWSVTVNVLVFVCILHPLLWLLSVHLLGLLCTVITSRMRIREYSSFSWESRVGLPLYPAYSILALSTIQHRSQI